MPDTSVKIYQSTDTGMPSITGLAGGILSALDLLVYGSSTLAVSALVVYNDVATVTVSAGHGLTMIGTIGPVVTIAGATPAGLNEEWRLASIRTVRPARLPPAALPTKQRPEQLRLNGLELVGQNRIREQTRRVIKTRGLGFIFGLTIAQPALRRCAAMSL